MNTIQTVLNHLESGAQLLTQLSDLISETWQNTATEADSQDQYISLISQILRDSEDIARSCENYLAKMDFIENKVLESAQEVEEIIKGKDRLSEKNKITSSSIEELQTFSTQIQDMGTAVIQISKQTNLLAYNVAIEATNTDDECKGFTVLSEEIRNLADTSASSAKDITRLTRELQMNLQTVITDVQKAGDTVTTELEKVKQTILTFNSINEKMISLFHSGRKIKNLSRDGISSSRDITGQSEWLFSLQRQLNSKRMHLLNVIEKELALHAEAIAIGATLLKGNSGAKQSLQIEFSNKYKEINAIAQEIERTIDDLFHTLNIIGTVGEHFKTALNSVGKTVTAINSISKKDEEQIQDLTSALKTDFSQVSTTVSYVQDILHANADILEKFHTLNSNSWNINHIIDVLINHTTMTKMLALNAALEATRTEGSEHDYDGVVSDMRILSEQSGNAATDIKKVMHQVEYFIAKVLGGINETMYSSSDILDKTKRFIKNLQIIQRSMQNSSDYLMEICIFSGMIWKNIEEANKVISKCETIQAQFSQQNAPLRNMAKSIKSQFEEIAPLL